MAGTLNKICGLWFAKDKNGKTYMRGNSKNGRFFMIFKNEKKREGKNDPDYQLCEGGCDDLQHQFTQGNFRAPQDAKPAPKPAPVQADPVTGEIEDDADLPF